MVKFTNMSKIKKLIALDKPAGVPLLESIADEIDFYRDRLEIDRYYIIDQEKKSSENFLGTIEVRDDEKNLGADKIDCLDVEIGFMSEIITRMQDFIESNKEFLPMNEIEGLLESNKLNKFYIESE